MNNIRNDEERALFTRLYHIAHTIAPALKGVGLLRGDPADMPEPEKVGDSELEMLAAGYFDTGNRQGVPREVSLANLRTFLSEHEKP